ncbi:MAG: transporter substrate-binding domain-containing protein, partial [Deltaproteobacteria bacterium]|nr:transporter substrate-binding domain-containing protein [Deltaproteobacteria bacterium]
MSIVYCEYKPFFFKGGSGQPRGLLVDFWRLWSEKTGLPIQFISVPSWEETMNYIREGKADINAAIFYSPERELTLDFSHSFFDTPTCIFYHISINPPARLDDLATVRIGEVQEDYSTQFLKKRLPNAKITSYPDYESLVLATINREVDAFLMESPVAMTYLAQHDGLTVVQKCPWPVYNNLFKAAVRKGNKVLLETVNQGITAISQAERDAIIRNWTGRPTPNRAQGTAQPLVLVGGEDQVPYYYTDEQGQMVGMLIDIWKLWSRKTNIPISFKNSSFSNSLAMVRDGEADVHVGCFYSENRGTYLDYGGFLANCYTHFFFHDSIYGLKNLEDLIGFRIGVMANDFAIEYIKNALPGAVLTEYDTNHDLFQAVKRGEVRVFVGDTPTALHYLAKMGILQEWHYHPERPIYSKAFFAAVGKGNTNLQATVNEGLEAITPQERTAIERRWVGSTSVKTSDVLTVAFPISYPPFSMLDSIGKPAGLFIDFWRRWAKNTGDQLEFRGYDWADAVRAVEEGEADVHIGLPPTPERKAKLDFSRTYYHFSHHLYYRTAAKPPDSPEHFKRIGLVEGTYGEAWVKTRFPSAQVIDFKSPEAMARAAAAGNIDAFLAVPTVMEPLLSRLGWKSAFDYAQTPLLEEPVAVAVRRSAADRLARIEAGMNALTTQELTDLESAWIADPKARFYRVDSNRIVLTSAEEQWLRDHPKIRIGVDRDWPPFEFVDAQGRYQGMASDYLETLGRTLGISTERVAGLSWTDVSSKAANAEPLIDMVPCAVPTTNQTRAFLFSRPYQTFPWVVLMRKEAPMIGELRDLYGKTVGVARDHAIHERLARDFDQIFLKQMETPRQCLQAVSVGSVDACIENLAAATFQIQNNNFVNLKVAAATPYGSDGLAFAVRSDWPELLSILNKGIKAMPTEEHDRIRRKWFSIAFDHGIDQEYLKQIALRVGVGVLAVFLLVYYWNRQLRRREERFRGLIERGSDIIQAFTPDGRIIYQSPSHTTKLGYKSNELIGRPIFSLFHPEELPEWREALAEVDATAESRTIVHRLRHKEGYYRYYESHCINLLHNNALGAYVINGRDLTERMRSEMALQQAKEEAETANRAKSEFLAGMSHEIRTPLNAIQGLIDITLRMRLDDEQKRNLLTAKDSARHLLGIIDDILDLSKIEAGKVTMARANFDLKGMLDGIERTYAALARQKGLAFTLPLDAGCPRFVKGDSVRLRQILINRVGNRLKFTNAGGI